MINQKEFLQKLEESLKREPLNPINQAYIKQFILEPGSKPIEQALILCHQFESIGLEYHEALTQFLLTGNPPPIYKIFTNQDDKKFAEEFMSFFSKHPHCEEQLMPSYASYLDDENAKEAAVPFTASLILGPLRELSELPPMILPDLPKAEQAIPNVNKQPEQYYKLLGENPLYFKKRAVEGKGDCAFLALNSSRDKFIQVLSQNKMTNNDRESIWMEICEIFSSPQYSTYIPEPFRKEFREIQEFEENWAAGRMLLINEIKKKDPAADSLDGNHYAEFLKHIEQNDPHGYQELTEFLSTENNALKKAFFMREDVVETYLSLFKHGLWGGVASIALYAKLSNINLTIYSLDNENNLYTMTSHFSHEDAKSFHLLFHQSSTHFDQLIPQESLEPPSKKRKTGSKSQLSATTTSLQEGMSYAGPLLEKEKNDLNFIYTFFSSFSNVRKRKNRNDEIEEPRIKSDV